MGKTGTRTASASCTKSTDERLEEIYILVTKDDMDKKVQKITDKMEDRFTQLKDDIRTENHVLIEKLEGRIFDLEKENDELREAVGNLENLCSELQDSQKVISSKHNDLEQQGRKNSIRIFGLEDPKEKETVEECKEKIVNFVNTRLKVSLRGEDIYIAHRLGKYTSGKKRSIIVKFTHRTKKHEVLKERRVLAKSGITIFEDLTKYNQDRLREAYRLDCVTNSYSSDGKLFVIVNGGKKRKIFFDTP